MTGLRVQDWGRMSRAEREAEYDNRGAVGNSAVLIDALFADSAARQPDGALTRAALALA